MVQYFLRAPHYNGNHKSKKDIFDESWANIHRAWQRSKVYTPILHISLDRNRYNDWSNYRMQIPQEQFPLALGQLLHEFRQWALSLTFRQELRRCREWLDVCRLIYHLELLFQGVKNRAHWNIETKLHRTRHTASSRCYLYFRAPIWFSPINLLTASFPPTPKSNLHSSRNIIFPTLRAHAR